MSGRGTWHSLRKGKAMKHDFWVVGQSGKGNIAQLSTRGIQLLDRAASLLGQLEPKGPVSSQELIEGKGSEARQSWAGHAIKEGLVPLVLHMKAQKLSCVISQGTPLKSHAQEVQRTHRM